MLTSTHRGVKPVRPPVELLDDAGEFRVTTGEFRGRLLRDLADADLHHIAGHHPDPDARDLAGLVLADRAALSGRGDNLRSSSPSTEPAAVVVPRLVWEIEQRIRAEVGAVVPGSEAELVLALVEKCVREVCTRYSGRSWPSG